MGAQLTTTSVDTLCAYCGVGCGLVLDIITDPETGRRKAAKSSGLKTHPTNFGRLCTKGTTTADMLAGPGRMESAYRRPRRGDAIEAADMAAVITDTAQRLRAIIDEHGPDAFALYVSGQMSLEAQYLSNKLAKGFIGTNQIESNSRLCMASAGTGYKQSLGADGPPGSYQDFEHADVFFVTGANMADCHPILFLRMQERIKAGAKLIVVDPRRTATADKANLFLQIAPGTDLALLNGLLHLLVMNGHTDPDFIADFTEGWEVMPSFLAEYTPEKVSEITGIPEADIRTAAQWIGEAANWMSCWTMGLNQSTHGTWNTNAICQPSPCDRCDLQARQRSVLVDRSAERHGWARNGLHGARFARSARRDGRRRSRIRRGEVGDPARLAAHRHRRWHHRHVLPNGGGRHQSVLDHLHQSRCDGSQPQDRHRRLGEGRPRHHPGCFPGHRDQRIRRCSAACFAVDRVRPE